MSNNNAFDDLLEVLQEPELKEAFVKAGEKYKEVKEYGLRQSDYSRHMNDLKEKEKGLDKKVKFVDAWEDWKFKNWDDEHKMTKAELEASQKLRELETENETLKSLKETEMTFEDVNQEVEKLMAGKLKGVLTEQEFKQKYETRLFDKAAYDKEVNDRMINWVAARDEMHLKLYNLGFKHKDEFGEILDPLKVIEFSNEKKIQDLDAAYAKMVEGRRNEKNEASRKAEIEAAEKRGEEKKAKEIAMSQGQNGRMPTDSGAPEMSHLQERILRRGIEKKEGEEKPIPDEIKLDGSGALGHAVADRYRQDKANAA